jgi:diguanylate cyclase (GGDEF)-like protein
MPAGSRLPSIQYPQSRDELQQWLCDRLHIASDVQPAVFGAIDSVLTRHKQLWEAAKDDALQALIAGFVYRIANLQRELSEKQTAASRLSQHFEQLVAELTEKAQRDPKTNLINFPRFTEQLESFLAVEQRSRWCAIGLADIARLKSYNDRLGHAVGDRIIGRVARLLQEQVRSNDLVARKRDAAAVPDLHSRFGGDEFCFLVPRLSRHEMAFDIAERFRDAVERYDWTLEDHRLADDGVRIDVGVVGLQLGRVSERRFIARRLAADLIDRADQLMYRAKHDPVSHIRFERRRIRRGDAVRMPDSARARRAHAREC